MEGADAIDARRRRFRGWVVQYVACTAVALIGAWPMIQLAPWYLTLTSLTLLVAWLASFLHLASSTPGKRVQWLLAVLVLSFASPTLLITTAQADVYKGVIGGLLSGTLGSVAALLVFRRLKSSGRPNSLAS